LLGPVRRIMVEATTHGTARPRSGGRGRALLRARPRRLRRGRLSNEDRRGALLGLDSTYRVCGRHVQAVASLRCGAEEFSPDGALRTFLAMALFNTGELHDSAWLLLKRDGPGAAQPHQKAPVLQRNRRSGAFRRRVTSSSPGS
jgi:hypothetical protein